MNEFLETVFLISKEFPPSNQSFLPVHKILKVSTLDSDNFEIIEVSKKYGDLTTAFDIIQILYHCKKHTEFRSFFIKADVTVFALHNINKEFPFYKITRSNEGLLFTFNPPSSKL
jgi:hypothetical protein